MALSLTKKDSCMPDAMDKGCDEVKLRGNFRAFPIMQQPRRHSCGLQTDGHVLCWGANEAGQATPP